MEVTIQESGTNQRTYTFDSPVTQSQLSWLNGNRNIESYQVSGQSLVVTFKSTADIAQLEDSFIVPGLKRTFGDALKINSPAHSSTR